MGLTESSIVSCRSCRLHVDFDAGHFDVINQWARPMLKLLRAETNRGDVTPG